MSISKAFVVCFCRWAHVRKSSAGGALNLLLRWLEESGSARDCGSEQAPVARFDCQPTRTSTTAIPQIAVIPYSSRNQAGNLRVDRSGIPADAPLPSSLVFAGSN